MPDKRQAMETFDTEREACVFCADIDNHGVLNALRVLHEHSATTSGPTLDDIAAQFFRWKAGRVRSDRTIADYQRDYRRAVAPFFGARVADSIIEADVQRWVDDLGTTPLPGARKPIDPKTIGDRHALLHSIFAYAAAPGRRLVAGNPCVGTDLPRRHKKPPRAMMPGEWQAFYAALRQIDPDAGDLALFLLASGWRFSEAAALPPVAVEDYGDQLYVAMGQVVRRNAAGEYRVIEDGKADASLRRIRLDSEAADMVRRRVDQARGSLVFTTATGTQWRHSNLMQRAWNPAVKASGLSRRPTPHWLRHTAVVWLSMSGAALPELQARIGHEDISTTIGVYGRAISDVSPTALEAFAALRGSSGQALPSSQGHVPPSIPRT
jgi:integrase